ncbi:hypothetical protein PENARI_c002G01961 [Penicillium arizonense]|uniref:Mitochondrial import protein 1 n=1 Tax=Penicillium arizonense TaxID=1835702 RepID=A0A1F5LVP4_PENAI|nr:hypothetical protein PENARI_c002G01961 [Penicillium arizonense]OGE57225.1 hypothetical protein PENARI_c002G01961 [Penicillium arizonense]
MASDTSASPAELYDSTMTVPSDSENYSANHEMSSSSTSSPMILYKPPTIWGILRGAAINLFLPFVNGLMLGFGELFAHEAAFRLGWSNTKIFPTYRRSHSVGPGVELRELPSERRRTPAGLKDTASLE